MKTLSSILLAGSLALLGYDTAAVPWYNLVAVGFVDVQGVIYEDGRPANGSLDWDWVLYSAPTGGTPLAQGESTEALSVSNGLANFVVDLGVLADLDLTPTQEVYLEFGVRPSGGSNDFTVLGPRQRVVPSAFATKAVYAEEARTLYEPLSPDLLPASVPRLDSSSTFTGPVTFAPESGAPFAVSSSDTVAGLTAETAETALFAEDSDKLDGYDSSEFWKLEGNFGTTAGTDFLGTTDDEPLELKVNNTRTMRFEPNASGAPNVIGGAPLNVVAPEVVGATIGGGGAENYFGSPYANAINADFGTIGGGRDNTIYPGATNSTISGGIYNHVNPNADSATIGGGSENSANAVKSTVAGGSSNSIDIGSEGGAVGGGHNNHIGLEATDTTIAGGALNQIGDNSTNSAISGGAWNNIEYQTQNSTIGGGYLNNIFSAADYATVGGGLSNSVNEAALYATVAGGYDNSAGRASTAIGGGERNKVVAVGATIAGGLGNTIEINGKASAIGGGANNAVLTEVTNSVIAGGFENQISTNANFSSVGGGFHNKIGSDTEFATIPGGREAGAFNYGQIAHASGGFGGRNGTAQESFYVVRGTTGTNQFSSELLLDGASKRIAIPEGSTWAYDVLIVGRTASGASLGWRISGLISNDAGTTAIVGAQVKDTFLSSALSGASVEADDTNDALVVRVHTNVPSSTWRWVATVRTSEVMFPNN